MAFKYTVTDQSDIYFITTTVVGWIDAFTRKELAEVIIESLRYCQSEKGLIIYAWCLMPSHLHMIVSAKETYKLSDIIRDFKKFTSKKIIKTIQEINESREWLLDKFSFAARINMKNKEFTKSYYHSSHISTSFCLRLWHIHSKK